MKHRVETKITINAPIDEVWRTFMDFENHHRWNHFVQIPKGSKKVGDTLHVGFLKDGDTKMTMKPTIVKLDEEQAFEWIGHLWIKGIFDGHHQFQFIALGNQQTEFIHAENFSGLLIRLLKKSVIEPTAIQFEVMNESFKSYIESNR